MKKFIKYIITFILTTASVFAATQNVSISKIENDLFGFEYNKDSLQKRIERLENTIYGKSNTGDLGKRLQKLSSDISADMIGLEITPTTDTFSEEDDVADSTVQYPVIDEIEKKIFGEMYKNRDLHTRIVTIERKLFGKIYDVDDYSTRMDRIKSKIQPEVIAKNNLNDENTLYSEDLSGLNHSRFNMPFGQKNYTRPYANYGDGFGSKNFVNNKQNIEDELAKAEYETFGTEFSNEDTATRIKRLNSVAKARKSAGKYDSNKFTQRMSTAIEIGAMILMILAMVL